MLRQHANIFYHLLISLLVVIGTVSIGYAQQIPMIHYTMEHGLPSNVVYDVIRDHNGFLWFSTDKGLSRYNGISFETFTMADGLPDDEVFFCKEDYQGRIWIGAYNGKLCFYKNGKFYTEKNCSFLKVPISLFVYSKFFMEKDSSITMMYGVNNSFVNIKDEKLTTVNLENVPYPHNSFQLMQINKLGNNKYLLQLEKKRVVIDTLGNVIHVQNNRNNNSYYSAYGVYDNVLFNDSGFYNCDEQLLAYKSIKGKKARELFGSRLLTKIYTDHKNLLLCTASGLESTLGDAPLFPGDFVTGVCSDNNGNYWVTVYGKGVYNVKKDISSYRVYNNVYNGNIRDAQYSGGKLYYTNSFTNTLYTFSNGRVSTYLPPKAIAGKPINWNIFCRIDERGMIVYDDRHNGLRAMLIENNRVYTVRNDSLDVPKETAYENGYFYGITSRAIYRLDINTFFKEGAHSGMKFFWQGVRQDRTRIMCSAYDNYNHCLWFCTIDSVYKIKGDAVSVQKNIRKPFRKFFCLANYIIGYDVNHVVSILKTGADGELHFIKSFQEKNVIWEKFYPLTDNKVIISTNNYYRIISFLPGDNIQVRPLEDPFIPRNAEYIYADKTNCNFFKEGNITSIPLASLTVMNDPPQVFFTALKTAVKNYTIQPDISINGNEAGNINIGFIASSFDSKEITYQYSISNDPDKDIWGNINSNAINLSSPGYGTYYIRLRARGLSTDYSAPAVLKLTILRPFWLTWWFITTVALILLIALLFTARAVVLAILNRRRKLYELESKYYSAEYKTLNALMNPHFIFNSLNNIRGLVNKDDKKMANKFLNSFSNVVRQNMQNLSKEMVSLYEEIQLVSKYLELEKLRFGNIINYEVNVSDDISLDDIHIPPLLIQPLAENAVKHGLLPHKSPDGLISINIYKRDHSIFIEVKDNGVGLYNSDYSEHSGYESLGLINIEKRLSYLRQSGKLQISFSIKNNRGADDTKKGTSAIIQIFLNE